MAVSVIDATSTGSTGSVMVSGNMPAFSAYVSGSQTLNSGSSTLVTNQTELFDTASRYNNTNATVNGIPAYSFLPNMAGYYQVIAAVRDNTGVTSGFQLSSSIYKNGVAANSNTNTTNGQGLSTIVTALIYLNGTTDYIQHYTIQNSGGNMLVGGQTLTYFQASMVRAA